MAKKICCICGKEFNGYGNNPEPVFPITDDNDNRNYCCNWCDKNVVIPERGRISELIRYAREHASLTGPDHIRKDFLNK